MVGVTRRLMITRLGVHAFIGLWLAGFAWRVFAPRGAWPLWVRFALSVLCAVALTAWLVDLRRLTADWRREGARRRRTPAGTTRG